MTLAEHRRALYVRWHTHALVQRLRLLRSIERAQKRVYSPQKSPTLW